MSARRWTRAELDEELADQRNGIARELRHMASHSKGEAKRLLQIAGWNVDRGNKLWDWSIPEPGPKAEPVSGFWARHIRCSILSDRRVYKHASDCHHPTEDAAPEPAPKRRGKR